MEFPGPGCRNRYAACEWSAGGGPRPWWRWHQIPLAILAHGGVIRLDVQTRTPVTASSLPNAHSGPLGTVPVLRSIMTPLLEVGALPPPTVRFSPRAFTAGVMRRFG